MNEDTPGAIVGIGMLAGLVPALWWAYIVVFTFDWHRSVRLNGLWIFAIAVGGFLAWAITGYVVATVLDKIRLLICRR